ncbi:hypothetical protein ACFPIJ_32495 [Dactylosporangium cerinum]|uniref:Transcription elongation factor GreB n=1 Tax=Dactylosporangium cerinum TaxID=1434730 RepID=A0ABV9W4B2_9ACTN
MADQQPDTRGDYVDERGVTITAAGRERARAKLNELDARWTPEQREERRLAILARIQAA